MRRDPITLALLCLLLLGCAEFCFRYPQRGYAKPQTAALQPDGILV